MLSINKLFASRKATIVAALAFIAMGAGWMVSGMLGPEKPVAKVTPPPITMAEPFTINLDGGHYIRMGVGVQLEPMTQHDYDVFLAGGPDAGGHGGGAATPGPDRLGSDAALRDAVIRSVSQFSYAEVLTPQGKTRMEQAILAEFDDVAKGYSHEQPKGAEPLPHNPAMPPYHIEHVYFTDYTAQ